MIAWFNALSYVTPAGSSPVTALLLFCDY